MHKLYVVAMLLSITVAFPMLPYIQLDYAHYFRLAQCQAMCTERYGILTSRQLLDGTAEEFLNVQNSNCEKCESGCHQHRRLYARGSRNLSQNSPMNDGLRFWAASSTGSAKTGSNVMSTVQLLCQNSVVDEEFGESVEGFVSISLIRPVRPIRFVIQWKQRTDMIGHFEDSQWITASVEHDSLFKVRGLIPGIQYRFMVTAVSVNGKLGDTVTSDWTEVSNGVMPKPPANSLTLSNGYNSNRGVMAQLQWTRTFFDSCYYKLQLSNGSYQVTTDITLDSSPSILLPHLQFDTNYLVTIAAVSADKTQTSKSITTHFRSLQCRDVHGHGSLQCLPEPVTDLTIVVRPNGTGLVSWNPSTDSQNILFYQLIYFAVTQNDGCQIRKQIFNVKATVTSTEVIFPGNQCEYLVRLINYDLLGRDASAEVRVLIERTNMAPFNETLLSEHILIVAFLTFILFVCIFIRLRCQRNCPVKVSEKQNKFSDYAKVDL